MKTDQYRRWSRTGQGVGYYASAVAAGALASYLHSRMPPLPYRPSLRKKGPHEPSRPLTTYHEDKIVYRSRRPRRRAAKRAKRSLKSFRKNLMSYAPPQFIRRDTLFNMSALDGKMNSTDCLLYTMQNSVLPSGEDVYNMLQTILPTTGKITSSANNRLMFKSAHMDISLHNNGTEPMYVDVYYVTCRRDSQGRPRDDWGAMDLSTWVGTAPAADEPNQTPFESRCFTRHWKITKHRRMLLDAQGTADISWSDTKRRFFDASDMANRGGHATNGIYSQKGWTNGVMWAIQGARLDSVTQLPKACGPLLAYVTKMYDVRLPPAPGAVTITEI